MTESPRLDGEADRISPSRNVSTFRDIVAWQRSMRLAEYVYRYTALLPDSERYGLCSQMRRAAVSIPSNIAEGYGRHRRIEFLRFLRMARGSLFELQTQLELCARLGFGAAEQSLWDTINETDRVLQGFIRGLEKCPPS